MILIIILVLKLVLFGLPRRLYFDANDVVSCLMHPSKVGSDDDDDDDDVGADRVEERRA